MELAIRCRRNQDTENKENLHSNQQNTRTCPHDKANLPLGTAVDSSISPQENLKLKFTDISFQDSTQTKAIVQLDNSSHQESNTSAFLAIYGKQIDAEAQKQGTLGSFLERHHIDANLRGRMADWMIEVTSSYRFEPKTYFDGILYLDKYLKAKSQTLEPFQLHSLGVAAMLLSSKQNQVYPLSLPVAFDRIGHKKIPISKLQSAQADIMKHLDYKLNQWSFFDIATTLLCPLKNDMLIPVLTYICRLIVIQYSLYSSIKPVLLGTAAAWVAARICNPKDQRRMKVTEDVEGYGRKIVGLVSGFRSVYPCLRNPDKFTESEVVRKVYQYIEQQEYKLI